MIFLLIPAALVVGYFLLGGGTGLTPAPVQPKAGYLATAPTYPGGTVNSLTGKALTYTSVANGTTGISPWQGTPVAQKSTLPGAAPMTTAWGAVTSLSAAAATLAHAVSSPPFQGTPPALPPGTGVPGVKTTTPVWR